MPGDKRSTAPHNCEHCGCVFFPLQCNLSRGAGRFCSRQCSTESRRLPLEFRFLRYVGEMEPNGCILWKGTTERGYGIICMKGRNNVRAHRMAYERVYGQIPSGMDVLHKCDNPPCINQDHLFLGTQAANIADMMSKGRVAKGECRPQHKLISSQVLDIRARYSAGGVSQYKLASEFGVCQSEISLIVNRKKWEHV